ncbi:unnamed protein product [Scytosiphon promiscuus]
MRFAMCAWKIELLVLLYHRRRPVDAVVDVMMFFCSRCRIACMRGSAADNTTTPTVTLSVSGTYRWSRGSDSRVAPVANGLHTSVFQRDICVHAASGTLSSCFSSLGSFDRERQPESTAQYR